MNLGSPSGQTQAQTYELLHRIGLALASEHDRGRLVETILLEAKKLCNADGGTLYLVAEGQLHFEMLHSDSLNIAQGGSTGNPIALPPIPLFFESGAPNRSNLAACAVHERRALGVEDAYDNTDYDFSGVRAFDLGRGYRTVSLLSIPLLTSRGQASGVIQLVNARPEGGAPGPFNVGDIRTVTALAAQAGIALENQSLLDAQKKLLDAFIVLIAEAIDAKSPYTGGHCERVPVLTEMIVRSLCDAREGPYAVYSLTDEEWRELRVAAWLHDCGKVTTPVHIMDKATKLETIADRIDMVESRLDVLRQAAETEMWRSRAEGVDAVSACAHRDKTLEEIEADRDFLRRVNVGAEFLDESDRARIVRLSQKMVPRGAGATPLLSEDETENLLVSRGTLTEAERIEINGHMVHTVNMLEKLPFPEELRRVPEYATGHHERMDGNGYPRGIFAGDMSLPARALAIADVFEALTASDRPYKSGKTLSETLRILAQMKINNHLDPELLDHFIRSGVYRSYANKFLEDAQCDDVDEDVVLSAQPKPFELPETELRNARHQQFLPEYRRLIQSEGKRPEGLD